MAGRTLFDLSSLKQVMDSNVRDAFPIPEERNILVFKDGGTPGRDPNRTY